MSNFITGRNFGSKIQTADLADGKATYNDDKIASDNLAKSWASLRQERNIKLADTDWRATSDQTLSDEWKAYRKLLRDFPSTLNDTTVLNEITWPEEPS